MCKDHGQEAKEKSRHLIFEEKSSFLAAAFVGKMLEPYKGLFSIQTLNLRAVINRLPLREIFWEDESGILLL